MRIIIDVKDVEWFTFDCKGQVFIVAMVRGVASTSIGPDMFFIDQFIEGRFEENFSNWCKILLEDLQETVDSPGYILKREY
jgi:hypothetical protein